MNEAERKPGAEALTFAVLLAPLMVIEKLPDVLAPVPMVTVVGVTVPPFVVSISVMLMALVAVATFPY